MTESAPAGTELIRSALVVVTGIVLAAVGGALRDISGQAIALIGLVLLMLGVWGLVAAMIQRGRDQPR